VPGPGQRSGFWELRNERYMRSRVTTGGRSHGINTHRRLASIPCPKIICTYKAQRIPLPPFGTVTWVLDCILPHLWSRADFFGSCRSDQSWERFREENRDHTLKDGPPPPTRRRQGRYDEVGRDDHPVGYAAGHVSYATEIHSQYRCLTRGDLLEMAIDPALQQQSIPA